MNHQLQTIKRVSPDYVVTISDLGLLLECTGDVELPLTLPTGFYVTLCNASGAVIGLRTPSSQINSYGGGVALTEPYQTVTVWRGYTIPGWVAQGL